MELISFGSYNFIPFKSAKNISVTLSRLVPCISKCLLGNLLLLFSFITSILVIYVFPSSFILLKSISCPSSDEKKCSLTIGSFTIGSLTIGSFTIGSLTIGSFTIGSLTTGSFTIGSLTTGSSINVFFKFNVIIMTTNIKSIKSKKYILLLIII